MAETRPIIDSLDSSDEEVTTAIKRKEPPTEQNEGDEPSKKRKSQTDQPGDSCYNCNETGHLSRDCTKPRPYESNCMTCHSKAHASKFCPKRIEALEQDRATLLQMQQHQQLGQQPNSTYSAAYPATTSAPSYPSAPDPYASLSNSYGSTAYGSSSYPSASTYPPAPTYGYSNNGYGGYPSTYEGYSYDPRTGQYIPGEVCLKCGRPGHKERDCHGVGVSTTTRCFNCNSKGHLAKDCKKGVLPTTCYNCGQPGHIGKLCPTAGNRACFICKGTGHVAAQCPQLPVRTCYNCGDNGHIGKNCPKPSTRSPCFKCQMTGHKAIDCPYGGATAPLARAEDTQQFANAKYY
jgi:cellular nucleic acid-binding protein